MKKHFLFVLFFLTGNAFVWSQLPPTIHRIAPVDTAVDMENRLPRCSVPSLSEQYGKAFSPHGNRLLLPGSKKLNDMPLRVEMLVRIDDSGPYSILAAHEPKNSPRHWELFVQAGNGRPALYLPGNKPDHLIAPESIVDGRWHRIALEFADGKAELFCDGNSLGSLPLNRPESETPGDTLFGVGTLVEGMLSLHGALDELRVSSGDELLYGCSFEPIESLTPNGPVEPSATASSLLNLRGQKIEFRLEGSLGELCGNRIGIRSDLYDRLFPSGGAHLEPTVAPGEKPPKNVPRLEGDAENLRKGVEQYSLTEIDPDHYRAGVFAHWGEQFVDLQNQIEGKTKLPRGAAEQVYHPRALVRDKHPAQVVLSRTGALLAHLKKKHPDIANISNERPSRLSRLEKDLSRMLEGLPKDVSELQKSDYFTACALRREILFEDPAIREIDRILFLGRASYAGSRLTNERNTDRMGGHFATQNYGFNTIHGGGIFTIAGWRTKTPEVVNLLEGRVVTAGAEGRLAGQKLDYGSFGYPKLDYDGQTLYFAHCGSQEHRWLWTPDTTWNLFKIQIDGDDLVQLTDGPYNDFDPCPLPDGRVVFISERRGGFIRCFDESAWLRVTTYVLHGMKNDGSDIYPISFFETSEWQPSVDNNGMLVYTRWDYTDRENCLGSNFWTCFPDGRNPRAPHGNYPLPWHTLDHNPLTRSSGQMSTGQMEPLREMDDFDKSKPLTELVDDLSFLIGKKHGDHRFGACPDAPSALPMTEMQIRPIPNSHKYVFTAAPHHGETFGSLCILDLREKNDFHMNQVRRITPYVPFPESESPGRGQYRYGSPWALNEETFLCNSWEDLVVLDCFGNEELICEREILPIGYDPRLRLTEPVPVRPRNRPPIIPHQTTQGEEHAGADHTATVGVVNVNISDMPLPEDRPIKSLRILQVVVKPNPWMNKPDIGYAPENTPRIPLGTVPVEDDGSVFFEAPPNKQLLFQTLDENGMAVQTMRSVAFVHPGERLVCNGCHEPTESTVSNVTHAKAFRRAPSKPEPEIGPVEPISFYRTVKPVFEQRCIGCHREQKQGPEKMDFADLKPYVFFYAGGMSGTMTRSGEAGGSRAIAGNVGAANSRLGRALYDANHVDVVSPEDRRRIILWLDANAPRLGAFVNEEAQKRGELVWPVLDCSGPDPGPLAF